MCVYSFDFYAKTAVQNIFFHVTRRQKFAFEDLGDQIVFTERRRSLFTSAQYWKRRDAVICQRCGALPETDDPCCAYHEEGEKEHTATHMEAECTFSLRK